MHIEDYKCITVNCELCSLFSNVVEWEKQAAALQLHQQVVASGVPNYAGCRVPLTSNFNIAYLEEKLEAYHDKEILEYIKFGWPVDHDGRETQSTPPRNHDSATKCPGEVRKYLIKEATYNAILGPFKHNPISSSVALSPLSTREKRDSTERRILVDMSFPPGLAVNEGIDKHKYQGEDVHLTYPSIDRMTELMVRKGRFSKLMKRDLKRAFRQFLVDPADIRLLGYVWEDHYFFDTVLAMGCRSSPYICQRVSNMLKYLYSLEGYECVNFLDDFGNCELDALAETAYRVLGEIMDRAGVEQSENKNCPPAVTMVFLGILLCTITMTMQVPPERLRELGTLLQEWLAKAVYARKELESLVGKLNFVCSCVKASRVFMARFLNALRGSSRKRGNPVTEDMRADICWWVRYLPLYNGITVIKTVDWSMPDELMSCDACLVGCGGWSQGEFFHSTFPKFIEDMKLHINSLELLTLTVAVKLWGSKLQGKRFVVLCDNQATVMVVNSGKSRDMFMQACLRELVWHLAILDAEIRVQHILTGDNRIADLLSRWELSQSAREEFWTQVGDNVTEVGVNDDYFRFDHLW